MKFTLEELYALNTLNASEQSIFGTYPEFLEDESGKKLGESLTIGYEELKKRDLIKDDIPQEECSTIGYTLESYQKAKRYLRIDQSFLALDVDKEKLFTVTLQKINENEYSLGRKSKLLVFSMFMAELEPYLIDKDQQRTDKKVTLAKERFIYLYGECQMVEMDFFEYNECTYSMLIVNTDEGIFEYDSKKEEGNFLATEDFKKKVIKMMKVVI